MPDRNRQTPTRAEDENVNPGAPQPNRSPTPTAKPDAGDARGDQTKLKQNREHLGVDDEHKTPDMKKGHRGTFP